MNVKETLTWLKHSDDITWNDASLEAREAVATIMSALEKQIPKMVIYSGDGYVDGKMLYDTALCPECGCLFADCDLYWGISVCPECHQSLKWSEE